ncbi:hypothetical protein ACTG4Q_21175 [Bradyrhizobium denitrificans]
MEVRTTQDSILKAFGLLLQAQSKPRQVKQKYVYRPFGSAVHASRRLTKAEGAAIDALVGKLETLDPRDDANNSEIERLLKDLSKLPVKFVPLKLEQRIDRSKSYPYRSTKRGG